MAICKKMIYLHNEMLNLKLTTMEKQITIENLQDEVTDLKITIEAKEAEIEKLKADVKEENGYRKMYDNLYTEVVQKYNDAKAFLRTIALFLETATNDETDRVSSARIDLIKSTIDKYLKP